MEIDGQTVNTLAVPPHAAVAPLLSGHGLDGRGQIVLGPDTLAQLGKRVGDTVVVSGGGVPVTRLRISGTATLPTIGITQAEHPSMGTGALIPAALAAPIWNAAFGPFAGPNAIFVRLRPGVSQAAAVRSLQQIVAQTNNVAHTPRVVAESGGGSAAYEASVLPVQRPAEIVNYKTMGAMPAVLAGGLATGAVAALGPDSGRVGAAAAARPRAAEDARVHPAATCRLGRLAGHGGRRRRSGHRRSAGHRRRPLAVAGLRPRAWRRCLTRSSRPPPSPLAAVAALVLANLVAALPGRSAARTPAALLLRAE